MADIAPTFLTPLNEDVQSIVPQRRSMQQGTLERNNDEATNKEIP